MPTIPDCYNCPYRQVNIRGRKYAPIWCERYDTEEMLGSKVNSPCKEAGPDLFMLLVNPERWSEV